MQPFFDLDLVFVGLASISIFILGIVVFLNNRKSLTNLSFFFLSLATVIWGLCNYFVYQTTNSQSALEVLRVGTFFAVLNSFFIFKLFYFFPEDKRIIPRWHKFFLWPFMLFSSLLTLTPYVFNSVKSLNLDGRIDQVNNGPGIIFFTVAVLGFSLGGLFNFYRKLYITHSVEKNKYKFMFLGTLATFSLILVFNFIFPAILNISSLGRFGAIYTFPFIAFTAYSIIKYKLFNVQIITTELIVFALWIFLLIRTLISDNLSDFVINGGLFLTVIVVGAFLIRNVKREVRQKEELQKLNVDLQNTLEQRENLEHLITHKVKGAFTRSKYIFAEMLEGTFGAISPEVKKMAEVGLESDNAGIRTVDIVLNAANLRNGTIKYDMRAIDMRDVVKKAINSKKVAIEDKKMKLELEIPEEEFLVYGDDFWLGEAIHNLIENAIIYSKEGGTVKICLRKEGKKVIFCIKDTGVGLSPDDKKGLFTQGGRGKDSLKVNVNSTGYGLYSVKLILDAHKGHIWAESEGRGHGSTFHVELSSVM